MSDRLAESALAALPHGGRDAIVLHVDCARGHHVAAVYATEYGPAVASVVRASAHGRRDRDDQPHHGQQPARWCALLDTADEAIPAWCACGQRLLDRDALVSWLDARENRVVID